MTYPRVVLFGEINRYLNTGLKILINKFFEVLQMVFLYDTM